MDIDNLLNTKNPGTATSTSPNSKMSQQAPLPQGSHPQMPGPSNEVPGEDVESPQVNATEYMSQYSPQAMHQPTSAYPVQAGAYPGHLSDPPETPTSEPSSATSQLPYDPIGERNRNNPPPDPSTPHLHQTRPSADGSASGDNDQPKAFACTTCHKGFARRSDLVRHERIHTGIRPHICSHPNCGKQFIQRSALTVHERVHTREKPHLCEKCGKPFSDSSSLARHRRIHSGTRPYQCPYADCQKTFTRRTTLTRHQNHHTGTVEEAAAARAAALASRAQAQVDAAQPPRQGPQVAQEQPDFESQPNASGHLPTNSYATSMAPGFQQRPVPLQGQPAPELYPGGITSPPQPKPNHQGPYAPQATMVPSRSQSTVNSHSFQSPPSQAPEQWQPAAREAPMQQASGATGSSPAPSNKVEASSDSFDYQAQGPYYLGQGGQ